MRRAILTGQALLCAVTLVACGAKLVREPIYESEDQSVEVALRYQEKGGEKLPRGYHHPALISDVRLAHILAHLQYEDKIGNKQSMLRSLQVYDLAEGLAKGLKRAGPDDEVLGVAYRRERNLGIFTVDRVTSLRAYVLGDSLMIDFFDVDKRLDKQQGSARTAKYDVPTELSKTRLSVDLVAGESHVLRGARGYAVDWRSPYFRRPVSLSLQGIRRRTILMEAEPEELAPEPAAVEVSPELRNAQLQALDVLDAQRRAGAIPEADFLRRRRLVLEGRLEEAGFAPAP